MDKFIFNLISPAEYVSGGWFSSPEPWLHPTRTLETYVLIIGVKGIANIKVDDRFFTVCSGDVMILPPHIEHKGYKSSHNVSYLWFHFLPGVEPVSDGSSITVPIFMHSQAQSRLMQLGIQLLHIDQAEYSSPLASHYQLSSILLEVAEQYRKQSISNKEDFPRKMYEIQEWIRVNAHQHLNLSQIAQHFHYNKNYLCKVFKKITGHTIQNHIILCKLEIAKQALLMGDLPIKQIAEMAGFTDEKYLMRVFRQYEGMTFSEFKNAYCRVHYNKI